MKRGRWAAAAVAMAAGCSGATVKGSTGTGGSSTSSTTGAACTNRCVQGSVQCVGTQVQSCQSLSSGCLGWSAPGPCPSGEQCSASSNSCATGSATSGSTTGSSCTNVCPGSGSTRCQGTLLQTCGQLSNGCLEWGGGLSCPSGQSCATAHNACEATSTPTTGTSGGSGTSGGTTGSTCTNACPGEGATQCNGAQVEICHSANGCLAWSAPQSCPAGQGCGGANQTCVSQGGTSTTSGTTGSGTTGSSTTGSSCTDQCTDGETVCAGAQVQTCAVGPDGCTAFDTAADCGAGQACDPVVNACAALCSVTQTQTDCAGAASAINGCCAGGFSSLSGDQLCAQEIQAGNDPDTQCGILEADTCGSIESAYQQVGICCCPAGDYCDEDIASWPCVQSCSSNADCTADPKRPSCAPNDNLGALIDSPYVCKPDDATAYDGCSGVTETCGSGFDCWSTGAIEVCTTSCNADADCGNSGVVCCDLSASCKDIFSCAANGACLPCGSF